MLKEKLYNKVVDVLNLNSVGLLFQKGYDLVMYDNKPLVVNNSGTNLFAYEQSKIIPVSEDLNQERPSINDSDRSDYIMQYSITFRLEELENVKVALEEYRAYFYANKMHVIDGYNVGFKVTRGDKQPSWSLDGGTFFGYYRLSVYATAIKNGYITQDTDGWYMRNYTENTAFVKLKITNENCAYTVNTIQDTSVQRATYKKSSYSNNRKFNVYYESNDLLREIYDICIGVGTEYVYEIYNVFDGQTSPTEKVIIVGASRDYSPNSPLILQFDVLKYE